MWPYPDPGPSPIPEAPSPAPPAGSECGMLGCDLRAGGILRAPPTPRAVPRSPTRHAPLCGPCAPVLCLPASQDEPQPPAFQPCLRALGALIRKVRRGRISWHPAEVTAPRAQCPASAPRSRECGLHTASRWGFAATESPASRTGPEFVRARSAFVK